jgi:hypothetical protein
MVFNNTFNGPVGNVNTQTSPSDDKVTEIDSIAAGKVFEHDGSVLIKKAIGQGAIVKIKNGGITVQGSVDDGVKIKVENSGTSNNITISGSNSVTFGNNSGGNLVIVNGSIISGGNVQVNNSFSNAAKNEAVPLGITLDGPVGDNVTLVSDTDIKLRKDAGSTLQAKSGRDFESQSLGDNSYVEAQRDVEVEGEAGNNTQLTAARDIEVEKSSSGSINNAARDFEAESIENATINAGRDAEIDKILGASFVNAGRDVEADYADESASVSAGRKKDISSVGNRNAKKPTQQKSKPGFIF